MCTAAGRKFQRVQRSTSCQGVRALPQPGGVCVTGVVLNGLVVEYPVMCEGYCVIVVNMMRIGFHQTFDWHTLNKGFEQLNVAFRVSVGS